MTGQSEVEAALVIVSGQPRTLIDRLVGLERVAEYALSPASDHVIHDTYFDTANTALARKGFALRIRQVDDRTLVTLKGPAEHLPGGGARRLEIEREWSESTLDAVARELTKHDIGFAESAFVPADPRPTLGRCGLVVVQDRKTHRRTRGVHHPGSESPVLAEMAIDTVTYRVGDRDLLHHEVEVEMKTDGEPGLICSVRKELFGQFGPEIRDWPYPKLPTGQALVRLAAAGVIAWEEFVDSEGNIRPRVYDRLPDYLPKS